MSAQEAKQQQQYKQILERLLQEPENKMCADCHASAPRWASSKLGVFLCIKCAGIHRSMGTHISFVRSVNLDKWKDNEIATMQEFGNRRAALMWEATLPEGFRRPSANDGYNLEKFIRSKYERKHFFKNLSREELNSAPSSPQVVPAAVEYTPTPIAEDNSKRLSSPVRRPIRRPPGNAFSPPSSPQPRSPPATDFGSFERPSPPVNLLSAAVDLLSLGSNHSPSDEFGTFTPPVAPRNEARVAASPTQAPASPAPVPVTVTQQQAKDSIMGLFEPAPAATAYSPYGYASPSTAPLSPQVYHHQPQAAYAGYYSPTTQQQYYQQPTQVYQQVNGYGYSQPLSPVQGQWAYGAQPVDPLMQQISSLGGAQASVQGTGLATLML